MLQTAVSLVLCSVASSLLSFLNCASSSLWEHRHTLTTTLSQPLSNVNHFSSIILVNCLVKCKPCTDRSLSKRDPVRVVLILAAGSPDWDLHCSYSGGVVPGFGHGFA